jgi:hypothetical protein
MFIRSRVIFVPQGCPIFYSLGPPVKFDTYGVLILPESDYKFMSRSPIYGVVFGFFLGV